MLTLACLHPLSFQAVTTTTLPIRHAFTRCTTSKTHSVRGTPLIGSERLSQLLLQARCITTPSCHLVNHRFVSRCSSNNSRNSRKRSLAQTDSDSISPYTSHGRQLPCYHTAAYKDDGYDRYRKPPTKSILQELKKENEHTRTNIDLQLYKEVLMEMHNALAEKASIIAPSELGPTGIYQYSTALSSDNRRLYKRTKCVQSLFDTTKQNDENEKEQIVINLDDPQCVLHAMSLTVDETCIAFLTDKRRSSTDNSNNENINDINENDGTEIWLRNIDSGFEKKLKLSDRSILDRTIINLEWGPSLIVDEDRSQNDGTSNRSEHGNSTHHHSLYFVTTDNLGRPDCVYGCIIDSVSLEQVTEPAIIYHSDNDAAMVDVQRTKGCDYVAIQSMTKTSNEIYLSSHPGKPLLLVRPRQERFQYHIDVGDRGDIILLVSSNISNVRATDTTEEMAVKSGVEHSIWETTVDALPLPLEDTKECNIYSPASNQSIDGYVISDIDLFQNYLVCYERSTHDGRQRISVHQRKRKHPSLNDDDIAKNDDDDDDDAMMVVVPLPESVTNCSMISPVGNMCFSSNSFRFSVESPVSYGSIYEYHFEKGQLLELKMTDEDGRQHKEIQIDSKQQQQQQQFPQESMQYHQERILVKSYDGTKVPLSLIYQREHDEIDIATEEEEISLLSSLFGLFSSKSSQKSKSSKQEQEDKQQQEQQQQEQQQQQKQNYQNQNKKRPIVLVGYGAYGECINLGYDPSWKVLLDRGFMIAFAHTRGGGELGKNWYHNGRMENKINAIEDYIACAEFLKNDNNNYNIFEDKIFVSKNDVSNNNNNNTNNDDEEKDGYNNNNNKSNSDNDKYTNGTTTNTTTTTTTSIGKQCTTILTAKTYSAGGVIVGAAINRNTKSNLLLFDNVVFTNAFLDVQRTLLNPNLFLTQHEWDEYGNPLLQTTTTTTTTTTSELNSTTATTTATNHDPKQILNLIQSYCPITNIPLLQTIEKEEEGEEVDTITNTSYPKVFVIGTLNDENVPYWNSVIYAKKVRKNCFGGGGRQRQEERGGDVLLHIERDGGHELNGNGGKQRIHIAALELAFIIRNSS